MKTNIISIVGKSNSGKTTLLEKLVLKLKSKGYKIGTVKHAHDGFEMDKKGKDSWRHQKAGADATLVITRSKIALVKKEEMPVNEQMQKYLHEMDLIIAEGFKRQVLPKIEVFRKASVHKQPLCMEDKNLVAFVTDSDYQPDVPVFGLEDIEQLVLFIEEKFINDQ